MSPAARRLLLVTGSHLTAYLWAHGTLVESVRFAACAEGFTAFDDYIAEEPDAANRLLLDLAEEEFHVEYRPHVIGGRQQMLERTAAKLFRDAPFRHWSIQGREAMGRRDDRVLFAAITNPEPMRPWLDRLHAAKAPIAAIRSLPHLGQELLKSLALTGRRLLLISEGRDSGLRQTVFRDNRLTLSRLTPLAPEDAPDHGQRVANEIAKTLRYLQRLPSRTADATLDVHVISDPEHLGPIAAHTGRLADVRIHPLTVAECTRRLGLEVLGEGRFADGLFAQVALRGAARNQYARPEDRRYSYHRTARDGLRRAATAVVALGIVVAGRSLLHAWAAQRESGMAAARTAYYEQLLSAITADEAGGIGPQRMRELVDAVDALRHTPTTPAPLLADLGDVFARFPEFRVDRLRWYADDGAAVAGKLVTIGAAPGVPTEDGTVGSGIVHAAFIEGRIAPFDGDYRRTLDRIDALLVALQTRFGKAALVSAPRRPLDVRSDRAVSGDAGFLTAEVPYSVLAVVPRP